MNNWPLRPQITNVNHNNMKFTGQFSDGSTNVVFAKNLSEARTMLNDWADEVSVPEEADLSILEYCDDYNRIVYYLLTNREVKYPLKSKPLLEPFSAPLEELEYDEYDEEYE